MGLPAIFITMLLAGVASLAYLMHDKRRYLTNNQNAKRDDFRTYNEPDETCCVCLEVMYIDSPSSVLLSCGHFLHQVCLNAMHKAKKLHETDRCPICRTPINYS